MNCTKYRSEIDGLRAFAVIAVILFHHGFSFLPGGFLGVDVFFVISGFLITSIICDELHKGSFSFSNFWARRIRRILPAMILVSGVTLVISYFFIFRPDQQEIGKQCIAALLSFSNIFFWNRSENYWAKSAEESPLLHTWSLSLEEQFYLILPLILWLIFRYKPNLLGRFLLFLTFLSFCIFLWGFPLYSDATFYLLPSRLWELCIGSLVAVTLKKTPRPKSNLEIFSDAGLLMIIASFFFIEQLSSGIALPVIGTGFILAFSQSGFCKFLLSNRLAVHIGKISYSLYLWHWPVLVIPRTMGFMVPGTMLDNGIILAITYLLSVGSYQLVEKKTRWQKGIIPLIFLCLLSTLLFAFWVGHRLRFYDTSHFDVARLVLYSCRPKIEDFKPTPIVGNTVIVESNVNDDTFLTGGIRIFNQSDTPQIVVLGDSHACMWNDAIANVVVENEIPTTFLSMDAVTPFFEIPPSLSKTYNEWDTKELKLQFDQSRLDHLNKWKPKLVIISAFWSYKNIDEAKPLLDFLSNLGSSVLLIEDPPILKCGDNNVVQLLVHKNVKPKVGVRQYWPYDAERDKVGRKLVRNLANLYENVEFLPTYDLFVTESGALILDGITPIYYDDDHVLQAGSHMIIPRLKIKINEIF